MVNSKAAWLRAFRGRPLSAIVCILLGLCLAACDKCGHWYFDQQQKSCGNEPDLR